MTRPGDDLWAGVRAEFGYLEADDRAAAEALRGLLPQPPPAWRDLGFELRNRRNLVILGCGPSLAQTPRDLLAGKILVAADGATSWLREQGVAPHVVVTDLDGAADDLAWAAARGSRMVVHAHGDNVAALREVVPRLGPLVHGTHQVAGDEAAAVLAPLRNVGGFTDGDRAVWLCEALGGRHAVLCGFDFHAPPSKYSHRWDPATKPAKLRWAERFVAAVVSRGAMTVVSYRPALGVGGSASG